MHVLSHQCPESISFHIVSFNLYSITFISFEMCQPSTGLWLLCSTANESTTAPQERTGRVIVGVHQPTSHFSHSVTFVDTDKTSFSGHGSKEHKE